MESEFKISVIGAGRFGSFWGGQLSRFFDVIYYDNGRYIETDCRLRSLQECLAREIVFVAVPISSLENFLSENGAKIPADSILVDLCSVKLKPKEYYCKYLPESNSYMLAHPLFGPDSARESLIGHKITISESRINKNDEDKIRGIFRDALKLEIIDITADEHDRLMAFNLSLMHHLGRTFNDMGIGELKIKMRSLAEIEKISSFVMNDSGRLFRDFYKFNPYSHIIRESFEDSFAKITSSI